jgi:hypothetical protein
MKVLLVSIAFPPKRDPESLQVAKYCKYLRREEDIDLEIITSANPTLFMETDSGLQVYRDGLNVVQEIPIFETKLSNFLIRKINREFLLYPDSKFSFWLQHNRAYRKTEKPDVLYSRSYPMSSTLLALELKKKWNIPWVLHLSDPWAVASTSSLSPATRFVGKSGEWNKRKEEECFSLADKICFTSQKTIQLYSRHYPQQIPKFIYMPNVYDDELVELNSHHYKEKLTFVYTGGFGEARTPLPLLQAIRKFWTSDPDQTESSVQFIFSGEMTRANKALFDSYIDVPLIKHVGIIPYSSVMELQKRADVLINIDSDIKDPEQAVFLPSKLLDYMIAQRRIMAITNRYSTTHEVVHGKLGDCFEFDDIGGMISFFRSAYETFKKKQKNYFYVDGRGEEFSAKQNARRLFLLLKELTH